LQPYVKPAKIRINFIFSASQNFIFAKIGLINLSKNRANFEHGQQRPIAQSGIAANDVKSLEISQNSAK
jgi:hypothetical protein